MAVQEPNQNQLQELALVVRRRAAQILLPAGVVLALAFSLAKLLPRQYAAQTGLELRETTLPLGGEGVDAKTIQRDVTNAPWQITQFERVRRVVEKLQWPDYTALNPMEQHEYVRSMQANIVVGVKAAKNQQGSSLITISYQDGDPQRAEQFLNRLREAFTSEVLERYRSDARQSLSVLANTKRIYEDEAKLKDEEAARVKKQWGVSATQQAPGGGRQRDEDPVFTRKSKAESELQAVEAQLSSENAALATLKQQLKDTPAEISQALLQTGTSFDDALEQIDTQIADQRELQVGLKPLNSIFQRAETRILQLEDKRRQLVERATSPTAQLTMVPNPARADLQKQLLARELVIKQAEGLKAQLESDVKTLAAAQAQRVETYRQIQALDREAQIAADNYMRATVAFTNQKRFVDLISEGYSNPFEVTEMARAPTTPTSPNEAFIIGGGLALGLALGLLSALASEYGRNGFRGVGDTSRALAIPVLGIVNRIRTRGERRQLFVRRALVGISTVALIAAIFWVTWAYEKRPQALGSDLVGALDRLRGAFR